MTIFFGTWLIILAIQAWVMFGWFVVRWNFDVEGTEAILYMIFWPLCLLELLAAPVDKWIAKL